MSFLKKKEKGRKEKKRKRDFDYGMGGPESLGVLEEDVVEVEFFNLIS